MIGYITDEDEFLARAAPDPDVRLRYGPHPDQFGELFLPRLEPGRHAPVAVLLHGGFWKAQYDLRHMSGFATALTRSGIAAWSVEYRRGTRDAGWRETHADVAAGAAHLATVARRWPIDLTRVVIVGFSSGGQLALAVGPPADRRICVRAIVSLAGVLDLASAASLGLGGDAVVAFLGGSRAERPDAYRLACPSERPASRVPRLVVHGERDTIVPASLSERYAVQARRRGDPVTLRVLPTGHFELVDPRSDVWPAIEEPIRQLLDSEPAGVPGQYRYSP